MSEKEDQGDPADVGNLTEHSEYEDDFENDPGGLTDEEEKQNLDERENPEEGEEEAQIPKAAESFEEYNEELEENLDQLSAADVKVKTIYASEKILQSRAEQEDHESDTERESSSQENKAENEQELNDAEDEEIKRYVLGKIEEANKELENQAPVDQNRERKLKFKDELDLQAPHQEIALVGKTDLARGDDVSRGLALLHISNDTGQKRLSLSARAGSDEGMADHKILVEKGRKFELLSIRDIESQGTMLPISVLFTDIETQQTSPKSSLSSSFHTASQMKALPPSNSKHPPGSASNAAKDPGKQKSPQKTESAHVPMKSSTYTLTPKQKELRKQIELRKERLLREKEEMVRLLEEERRRENDLVFRVWLQKKKEKLQEEKRIRRAKQMEELSIKEGTRDPEEAYRLWLKKKHQQYVREKRIEFLRRQAEEVPFLPRAEDCDRAFRDWLRKKREEKREAELADKERARQLRLEARRARRMRNMQYI